MGGGDVVGFAGDLDLVGAGAQLHFGELLDAREVAVVDAIELDQHGIVFERGAAGDAHAAASQGPVTISPARLLAWPAMSRASTMRPISRALPSA